MTDPRAGVPTTNEGAREASTLRHRHAQPSAFAERLAQRPRSREEAEDRYVAARDAWTAAMRQSRSGKSADLAALAMAQEAYEAALEEKERWANSPRVSIPVAPDPSTGINAVVRQELSWRRMHEPEPPRRTGLRGLVRRLRGR